jgi:putative MATE family efflux protein
MEREKKPLDKPVNTEERLAKMLNTPVGILIITLGFPSVVINIVTSIYNMADTYFVSYLGTSAVAGVGVVFPLMHIIQALGFFFGQGSGNFISRELGAGHNEHASEMAATGFFSAFIMCSVLGLLGLLFINPLGRILGATATILPYARSYMFFILAGAPFMAASLVLNTQLRFQGSSFYGMIGMMTGAVLNMILDPLFIFVFHMGVIGASLATAISQVVGCVVLFLGCSRKGNIRIDFRQFSPKLANYKEVLYGGTPSLLRQSMGSFVTIIINHFAAFYGDAAIAALAIVYRVIMTANSALLGFGQGFQPVCGFNYGAKRYGRVREAFSFCVKFFISMLVVLAVLLAVFAPRVIGFFRNEDTAVLDIGVKSLRLSCISLPFLGFVVLCNMALQTMGKAGSASFLALARQGLFLLPVLFILTPMLGLLGIQLSQPISDIITFISSVPLIVRVFRKMDA